MTYSAPTWKERINQLPAPKAADYLKPESVILRMHNRVGVWADPAASDFLERYAPVDSDPGFVARYFSAPDPADLVYINGSLDESEVILPLLPRCVDKWRAPETANKAKHGWLTFITPEYPEFGGEA